jgi:hypothetical protein
MRFGLVRFVSTAAEIIRMMMGKLQPNPRRLTIGYKWLSKRHPARRKRR